MLYQLVTRPLQLLFQHIDRVNDPYLPVVPADEVLASRVKSVAQDVRVFLEPFWKAEQEPDQIHLGTLSEKQCAPATEFLIRALKQQENIEARHRFGNQADNQGFRKAGIWYSHACAETGGVIVDITGDQFGTRPVNVTSIADPRYSLAEGKNPFVPYILPIVDQWWDAWEKRESVQTHDDKPRAAIVQKRHASTI